MLCVSHLERKRRPVAVFVEVGSKNVACVVREEHGEHSETENQRTLQPSRFCHLTRIPYREAKRADQAGCTTRYFSPVFFLLPPTTGLYKRRRAARRSR